MQQHSADEIRVTFQGGLISINTRGAASQVVTPRGNVTTFSSKSRLRMMRLVARLTPNWPQATFVTLTFSGTPSPMAAKQALKRLKERLRRFKHNVSFLWRMEFQKRGAPHFHLIIWNFPYVPQRTFQSWWEACTGEHTSIVDLRRVRNRRQASAYVSKYLAKEDTSLDYAPYPHAANDHTGRFWGVHNRAALPFSGAIHLTMCRGTEVYNLIRAMRHHWRGFEINNGGAHLFVSDAMKWYTYLAQLTYPTDATNWQQVHEQLCRKMYDHNRNQSAYDFRMGDTGSVVLNDVFMVG